MGARANAEAAKWLENPSHPPWIAICTVFKLRKMMEN